MKNLGTKDGIFEREKCSLLWSCQPIMVQGMFVWKNYESEKLLQHPSDIAEIVVGLTRPEVVALDQWFEPRPRLQTATPVYLLISPLNGDSIPRLDAGFYPNVFLLQCWYYFHLFPISCWYYFVFMPYFFLVTNNFR